MFVVDGCTLGLAYREMRDESVNYFLHRISRGKHSFTYKVRAEIPGKFSYLRSATRCTLRNYEPTAMKSKLKSSTNSRTKAGMVI